MNGCNLRTPNISMGVVFILVEIYDWEVFKKLKRHQCIQFYLKKPPCSAHTYLYNKLIRNWFYRIYAINICGTPDVDVVELILQIVCNKCILHSWCGTGFTEFMQYTYVALYTSNNMLYIHVNWRWWPLNFFPLNWWGYLRHFIAQCHVV